MKIFFCDNRLGGLLGFRIEIIKHFVSLGHDVSLIAPPVKTLWDTVGETIPPQVRVIEVEMQPSGLNPIKDIQLLFHYISIFRKERPDVVFNYTIKPNIYSTIAATFFGCRAICMLAGLGYVFDGDGFLKSIGLKLYKYGLSKAEKVIVLNRMNYDKVMNNQFVSSDKLLLLSGGEGVDLFKYAFKPVDYSNGVTFLMVSRVLYDKGYSEFVNAARIIGGHVKNVKFEILGPMAYDSPMGVSKEVFDSDLQNGYFCYLGVAPTAKDYMSRPDVVVVLPSKYGEGLNRSLMEACSIGRPIITTDVPGCRETVKNGENGYLISKGNSDSLVNAIINFTRLSIEEKTKMAESSRRIAVEKFDIREVVRIYDGLIR